MEIDMAVTLNQFSPRLNVWAMIKGLVAQNVGFFTIDGNPSNGTSGTYAGYAGPGSILIKTTSGAGAAYVNTNTLLSPTWTAATALSAPPPETPPEEPPTGG